MPDKETSDDITAPGSKLTQIVPEVYFDLISRVPAGALLIIIFMWFWGYFLPKEAFDLRTIQGLTAAPITLLIVLLIGLGYVVGIMITPLGYEIYRLFVREIWKKSVQEDSSKTAIGGLITKLGLRLTKGDNKQINLARFSKKELIDLENTIHNYLKKTDEQAKVILPKMRAEAALCNHITVIMLIVAVVFTSQYLLGWAAIPHRITHHHYLGGWVIFFLSCWASKYRHTVT